MGSSSCNRRSTWSSDDVVVLARKVGSNWGEHRTSDGCGASLPEYWCRQRIGFPAGGATRRDNYRAELCAGNRNTTLWEYAEVQRRRRKRAERRERTAREQCGDWALPKKRQRTATHAGSDRRR